MNTTHKDLNPLNKIAKNIKDISGVSPTPTPSGDNVHVYVLEFNYEDAEEYEGGYCIDVDSDIKATILNDYQTYGQDHCYFAKIVLERYNYSYKVMFAPISFLGADEPNLYPEVEYECEDNATWVYFYDDYIELDHYNTQAYQYTNVHINEDKLIVNSDSGTYEESDAVRYLFDSIFDVYKQNSKLRFSNHDTEEYCMLTCSYQGDSAHTIVFTGKVNNKPIALILTINGDNYDWKLIGRTLEVGAYNGGLIYNSPSDPVTYKDFYEELNLCYSNDIPFELELRVNKVTINNKVTDLTFNKWDYIYDETNDRDHYVSTIIHPDGYVISVDILMENSSSQVMYNIITL